MSSHVIRRYRNVVMVAYKVHLVIVISQPLMFNLDVDGDAHPPMADEHLERDTPHMCRVGALGRERVV